ncbi:uncharacterized protein sS8_1645 [Methylocaldum marinum]|uniref:Uncharacterized protein n=1 Tax=Methylocaldum marinum TaxID=1432792 RepID=A0A250KPZ2_9GAMM|nr:uncharacterized protein sS8_1645 [Methylocaldum marinum]
MEANFNSLLKGWGYRVMYRLESDRVLILAVMHGRRDAAGQDKTRQEAVGARIAGR